MIERRKGKEDNLVAKKLDALERGQQQLTSSAGIVGNRETSRTLDLLGMVVGGYMHEKLKTTQLNKY